MKRIGKDNSLFACWAYKVFQTNEPYLNELINKFYAETIHGYWDLERRHVDEEYKNVPFPFEEIENPGFTTRLEWNLGTLEGYLNTWSAVTHYISLKKRNPVDELLGTIKARLAPDIQLQMTFPIFMRIGRIKKQ